MIRAFLAVELSEDLRKQLGQVQQDLKQRLGRDLSKDVRISWVQPGSIHLTFKFLGDTDEALVEPMREAIDQAVKGHRAIQIQIERLGAFPHVQQCRGFCGWARRNSGRMASRQSGWPRCIERLKTVASCWISRRNPGP